MSERERERERESEREREREREEGNFYSRILPHEIVASCMFIRSIVDGLKCNTHEVSVQVIISVYHCHLPGLKALKAVSLNK